MSSKYALSIKTKINCLSGAACAVMLCEINFLSHRPRGPVDNKIGITQAFFFYWLKILNLLFFLYHTFVFQPQLQVKKRKHGWKKNAGSDFVWGKKQHNFVFLEFISNYYKKNNISFQADSS